MSRVGAILAPLHGEDAGSVFDSLCQGCVREFDVSGAGVALILDGESRGALGASGATSRLLEDLQFTLGEGPCLDAHRSGTVILEPHLDAAVSRWPAFGPGAVDAGVAAVFAVPLQIGAAGFGALDLFRDAPGPLTSGELADAWELADAVTLMVVALQADAPVGTLPDAFAQIVEYRAVVHQAAGMVSVHLGLRVEDALVALRAHAYQTGLPIAAVAGDIVARRLRLDAP